VRKKEITVRAVVVTTGMLFAGTAHAFDMGNMMNPSKWMGGDDDHDRYDDYGYGGPGYGYGGYPGFGYGGPGYGYGGYPGYGYGGPGYGYGGYPGYGYGGYPGYGYGATPSVVVPGGGSGSSEIEQLKDRIRELEGEVR
jgi:hypothetical protein